MAIFRPGTSRPCGFSQKTCLPAATAALRMQGMEMRRQAHQHHVDAALDQLLVGVEADEAMVVVDRHLLGVDLLQAARGLPCRRSAKTSAMATRPDVLAGVHGVGGRPAAAAAAADQADLDHVAARGVCRAGQRQFARRHRDEGCLKEAAARAGCLVVHHGSFRSVVGWMLPAKPFVNCAEMRAAWQRSPALILLRGEGVKLGLRLVLGKIGEPFFRSVGFGLSFTSLIKPISCSDGQRLWATSPLAGGAGKCALDRRDSHADLFSEPFPAGIRPARRRVLEMPSLRRWE